MNNTKKCVWFFSIIIFLSLILYVYRNKTEKKEFIKKDNRIAVFINDKEVTNGIPSKSSGYIFDRYSCSDSTTILDWDSNNWGFSVSDVGSSVICKLYFKDTPKPYLVDTASVGQFVDYTPPDGKNSSSKSCLTNEFVNKYSGWRVFKKDGSGLTGKITIIHAGTPECYKKLEEEAKKLNSFQIETEINNIGVSYVNYQLASAGRCLDCNDVKGYDGTACNGFCKIGYDCPIIGNDIIKTGVEYWLSSVYGSTYFYSVFTDGTVQFTWINNSLGVRPVIVLKSGIKNTGGLGTNESPFTISN